MKGYRSVHINGQEWGYRIGNDNLVARSPKGQRKTFKLTEVLGISWDAIDEGRRNGTLQITPAIIKEKLTLWADEFDS